MSIVGESGLSEEDQRYLAFAAAFENTFLDQGDTRRTLVETLDLGWRLLDPFPGTELKRLTADQLAEHHRPD
jgi:V/A-type H+-transporting ATPase subunit B